MPGGKDTMNFKIITVARWFGNLTSQDVSDHYDAEHPYMAFDGPGWNALRLALPFGSICMTTLKKDMRKGKHAEIGNYFSSRAKAEIQANFPRIDIRNMR